MTLRVDVRGDMREIKRHLNATQRKALPRATVRAINRGGAAANTATRREMSRRTGIKQKTIGKRLKLKKAKRGRAQAVLTTLNLPIPASRLGKPTQTARGAKVSRAIFPRSFVARMPSGHVGVFKRKGRPRLPIKEVTIPIDPPFTQVATKHINTTARTAFVKEFERLMKVAAQPRGAFKVGRSLRRVRGA